MKIKTSELSGVALDWAVAQAAQCADIRVGEHGVRCIYEMADGSGCWANIYSPSTDWSQGGPLIERFALEIIRHSERKWCAVKEWTIDVDCNYPLGETMLIAACRAIVAAKLGDEVDVPEGLV